MVTKYNVNSQLGEVVLEELVGGLYHKLCLEAKFYVFIGHYSK